MTLYKSKIGRYFKLNENGKKFIRDNYYSMTYDELSDVIGLSKPIIKRYASSIGYEKRKVGDDYLKFKNKVLDILRPFSGKLMFSEMLEILKDLYDIILTKNQIYHLVKDSDIYSCIMFGGNKGVRVFIDGNKDNLSPENIVLLTVKEYKYLTKIAPLKELKGDALLAAIELARLRIAKNKVEEVYIAKNLKTGEVRKASTKCKISKKITKRLGQYADCKKIGENGERYIRDWVVTRHVINIKSR